MTRNEIVDALARERRVEQMVESICHSSLSADKPDLQDLAQMVYLIILEYDEDKIVDLWEHNEINFFLARIILNQYRSNNSPFHSLFRKFQLCSCPISVLWDVSEEDLNRMRRTYKPKTERYK